MLNDVVSTGNMMVGRMLSGLLALSLDHPFVLACILATLMGATVAVLLDVVRPRTDSLHQSAGPERSARPRQ